jgi:hypothetical protein
VSVAARATDLRYWKIVFAKCLAHGCDRSARRTWSGGRSRAMRGVLVRTSKRPASSGADERHRPAALTVSNLPQRTVTQERGVAFALFCKNGDLLRETLFFAFVVIGQVENRADVFERR